MMANTLDLDPEWGGIDLIEEVERAFGIKIADEEARRCWTVGDLYNIICAHSPAWDAQQGKCASSVVFYNVRRGLAPEDKSEIRPRSPLTANGMSASQLFRSLQKKTGLRLPSVEATWIGMAGGWMCLIGFIGGLIALFTGEWVMAVLGAIVFGSGWALLRLDPARLPQDIATVGDLVRRSAPLNVGKLKEVGTRPPDRWSILAALAAEHGSLPPAEIAPDTFLLRKEMEMATAQG